MVLVLVGTFADIVVYFVFVTVAFIAMSVAALYRLPETGDRGFKTPLRRLTPLVFVGLCVLLLTLLLAGRTAQALLGALVVALGVPVYEGLRRAGILRAEAT